MGLGIVVKRCLGLNRESATANASQMTLLRRYINSSLLSQQSLKKAFDILGTHYEMTSVRWQLLGRILLGLMSFYRLYSGVWVRRSGAVCTGQALESIVLTLNS